MFHVIDTLHIGQWIQTYSGAAFVLDMEWFDDGTVLLNCAQKRDGEWHMFIAFADDVLPLVNNFDADDLLGYNVVYVSKSGRLIERRVDAVHGDWLYATNLHNGRWIHRDAVEGVSDAA